MFRDEVDLVCNEVNGTNVEITSQVKFNSVTKAIIQWINQSPKVKEAFYDLRLNFRFWTSSAYDREVCFHKTLPDELINWKKISTVQAFI